MDQKLIDLEHGWSLMLQGISKLENILEGMPEKPITSEEYFNLYTIIYNMCTQKPPHNYSKDLYEKYVETFDKYIKSIVLPSLRDKHLESLLQELLKRWDNYKLMLKWLSRFFFYLERYYLRRNPSLPSLNDVALSCFRDLAFIKVKDEVTNVIISLIRQEREGNKIDSSLLKNVLDMYVEIGMDHYEHDFEVHMLADASTYYARKAAEWIAADYSSPDYMLKVEESLKREMHRVREAGYLHSSSNNKLVGKVQHELLVSHLTLILENENSGFCVMLQDERVEDLSRMYRLYQEIPKGLEHGASIFKNHIIIKGTTLIQESEDASSSQKTKNGMPGSQEHDIIRKFIKLHDKYMGYVKDCFKNNTIFHNALKEAFKVICNESVCGIPSVELVSMFLDNIFKKGGGSDNPCDEGIDETLDRVVYLLLFNNNKDMFAEFHRKKLASQLLHDRSDNNMDHEKNFLSKLKQAFGNNYTSKMEGMMTDIHMAKDYQTSYKQYLEENKHANPEIDLSIMVLTSGFWPSYKSCGLNLPPEMVKCVDSFNGYYKSKTKHRKLIWIDSMGSCTITGNFQHKPIELVVSTIQAAALMLFNNTDKLSYSEMKTHLGLDDEVLACALHCLSCAKYKILSKEPNDKIISHVDKFEFNLSFTDQKRRIKIPFISINKGKKVIEEVDKDRRYTIDAAVVRIMKSRKVLRHEQLVLECVQMMSQMFEPDIKLIKQRIEHLIDREFLERDADNSSTYKYIA